MSTIRNNISDISTLHGKILTEVSQQKTKGIEESYYSVCCNELHESREITSAIRRPHRATGQAHARFVKRCKKSEHTHTLSTNCMIPAGLMACHATGERGIEAAGSKRRRRFERDVRHTAAEENLQERARLSRRAAGPLPLF
jgi:hypothetical protein